MKFNELVDSNGTTLKSYAVVLQEKAREHGLMAVMVFVGTEGPNKGIHAISSMDGSVGHALVEVGRAMLGEPSQQQTIPPVSRFEAT